VIVGDEQPSEKATFVPRPRARRWSLYVCMLLGLGFVLGRAVFDAGMQVPWAWWLAGSLGMLTWAAGTRGRVCAIALSAAAVLFGAAWFNVRVLESLVSLPDTSSDGQVVEIAGVLIEAPEAGEPGRGALADLMQVAPSVELRVVVTHGDGTGKTVRARVPGILDDAPEWLRPGTCVHVVGKFSSIAGARNPGQPDRRLMAAAYSELGDIETPDFSLVTMRGREAFADAWRSIWYGGLGAMHARAASVLRGDSVTSAEDREARALLGAFLLGERDAALRDVSRAFQRLGLLHLVAISGFNLVVMGGVVLFLLRLTGDRGGLEPLIIAALTAAYMLVLPAQAPIMRAGFIMLATLLAEALGRRHDRVTILGWVACVLLLVSPLDLWSLGFQLSVGIVCVLLLLGDVAGGRLFGVELRGLTPRHVRAGRFRWTDALPPALGWLANAARANVSASVLAWAVSMPLIALHTGMVSPLAVLTTLIVLPLTVVVLWVGYVALLIGIVTPTLGGAVVSGVLDACSRLVVWLVMTLDQLPGMSFRVPAVSAWWTVGAVGAAVFIVRYGRVRDRLTWALVIVIGAWFVGECVLGPRIAARNPVRIDALSVGRGSCQLIRTPTSTIMYACGSWSTGIGVREVPEACRGLGVWRVPTIVVPSPGLDVLSGVVDVVEPLGVKTVLIAPSVERMAMSYARTPAGEMLRLLRERGVEVRVVRGGDVIEMGEARLELVRASGESDSLAGVLSVRSGIEGSKQTSVVFTAGLSAADVSAFAASSELPAHASVLCVPSRGTPSAGARSLEERLSSYVLLISGDRPEASGVWNGVVLNTAERGCVSMAIGREGRVRTSTFK
jgi:ComEC/Rec2-related protein